MAQERFIVGIDAPTEAEAQRLAEEAFGAANIIRGERIDHKPTCLHYLEAVITDTACDCPRQVFYSSVNGLANELRHSARNKLQDTPKSTEVPERSKVEYKGLSFAMERTRTATGARLLEQGASVEEVCRRIRCRIGPARLYPDNPREIWTEVWTSTDNGAWVNEGPYVIAGSLMRIMDEGIEILAGPFPTKQNALDEADRLNPEGWSGIHRPRAAEGYDGQWYAIIDHNPLVP